MLEDLLTDEPLSSPCNVTVIFLQGCRWRWSAPLLFATAATKPSCVWTDVFHFLDWRKRPNSFRFAFKTLGTHLLVHVTSTSLFRYTFWDLQTCSLWKAPHCLPIVFQCCSNPKDTNILSETEMNWGRRTWKMQATETKKKRVDYQQQDEGRFHTERSRCHGLDKGRWWWWKPSRARDVSSSGSEKKNRFLFCRYAGSNQKGLREFRKRGEEEQKKGNMGKCSVVLLVKFMILAPTRRGHQQKPWDGHMNPCNCPERARGGRTRQQVGSKGPEGI